MRMSDGDGRPAEAVSRWAVNERDSQRDALSTVNCQLSIILQHTSNQANQCIDALSMSIRQINNYKNRCRDTYLK